MRSLSTTMVWRRRTVHGFVYAVEFATESSSLRGSEETTTYQPAPSLSESASP